MENFWIKLNKPIYALAPLAGYTDSAFRQICKQFGADVVYSEMASATALCYAPAKTLELLSFSEKERPYVVQLFGSQPEHFAKAVKMLSERGVLVINREIPDQRPSQRSGVVRDDKYIIPDGIDINFGCPVRKVAKQGAGAVLMDDKKRAREIVMATIENTGLPVSIKIRAKAGETDALEFLDYLRELPVAAVMIHGRTLKQGFSGPVDVAIIKKARAYFGGVILANGGVGVAPTPDPSPTHASREKGGEVSVYVEWLLEKSGADGIGIARGALGRPWIFKAARTGQSLIRAPKAVFKAAIKHAELTYELKGGAGIIEMRKHLCAYMAGLAGAKKLREGLVNVRDLKGIHAVFKI